MFSCHISIFPIVEEMKVKSHSRIRGVIGLSLLLSLIIFIIVGLFGYLQFASATDGNILNNYTGAILVPGSDVKLTYLVN